MKPATTGGRRREAELSHPGATNCDQLTSQKPSHWSNRGKLDVPKERFISYPNAGRDSRDRTELLGWAGWDHAEQASPWPLISARIDDGWDAP